MSPKRLAEHAGGSASPRPAVRPYGSLIMEALRRPHQSLVVLSRSNVISCMTWMPYALLTVFTVPALVRSLYPTLPGPDTSTDLQAYAMKYAAACLFASLAITMVARMPHGGRAKRQDVSFISHWAKSYCATLVLPGRIWFYVFAWLIYQTFGKFLIALLISMILILATLSTDGFSSPQTAPIFFVTLFICCCITVGGRQWSNQYGSGISGGSPVGCWIATFLIISGLATYVILLACLVMAAAFPPMAGVVLASINLPGGNPLADMHLSKSVTFLILMGVSIIFWLPQMVWDLRRWRARHAG